ncbi:hypothetical protein LMG28688_02509 [Paraburkholderia caffeinitolerans]|uniref:Fido domain-containing protein n=1 Tax=Paraburkholderia caffeinitolerans TaxID=1723730 RepID=A0A6J5FV49_9BURK|nr:MULTISPECIES: hypothetical protein [Paraburkholderia]CAB3787639.1 hypothetical protein LMG28688_02509 [Paraburkholderia caffeinitolerans]
MGFGYQDVVDCNRVITGHGNLSVSRRGQHNLTAYFGGGEISANVANICQAAHAIVTRQYFDDGNHRTGVLLIYTVLIRKCMLVSRKKAYQVYAFLDEAFHRSQTGKQSNLDTMTNFIESGGFMKLKERHDLVDEYVGKKEAEVLALNELLPNLARAPQKPREGVEFTEAMRQQIKENNAELKAWREKRRIFMDIKGGTASHSSDQ